MSLTRARIFASIFCLALVASGCGDEASSGDEGATSDQDTGGNVDTGGLTDDAGATDTGSGGGEDAGSEDTGAEDTGSDDAGTADTGAEDDCPKGDYCECKSNGDCDSGYCIAGAEGKYCAQTCVDSCKKDGFICVLVALPGASDKVNICVAEGGNVCNPCNKNSDCSTLAYADAKCVDNGDAGAFCGQGCKTDNSCAVGYECKEVSDIAGAKSKQCVPKGGAVCKCSKAAISQKLSTTCHVKTGSAKCAGQRKCLPDGEQGAPPGGGLSACLADKADVEKCDGKDNDCDGSTDEETCDDKNACTADSCDAKNAQCKHVNQDGGCDADGSKCTKDDVCSNGVCKAGKKLDCDDKNACTKDTCDPKDGCKNDADVGAACDADNNLCTENDKCDKTGSCKPGAQKSCTNNDPCITGKCKITTGKCAYSSEDNTPCNDGNACTEKDTCKSESCKGTPASCDDKDACTTDSCDKKAGCKHDKKSSGPCDDGDLCTLNDICEAGACKGKGAKDCNDGKACTDDSCDKKKGCINKLISNKPCNDGNGCTVSDVCKDGKCESGKNKCTCQTDADCKKQDDGNLCNGSLFCDKSQQQFECKIDPKTVVKCDLSKDNTCHKTSCTPKTGKCLPEIKNLNGKACSDDSKCTKADVCKDGKCLGDPVKCDDGKVCTDDSCDPKTGCTTTNNTSACNSDNDACTVGDKCSAGACDPGQKKDCNDSNACTKDACDAKTGKCSYADLTTACDDGNPCTVGDKCGSKAGKWQCVSGKGPDCDDKNPCTKDTCDPKDKGCKNVIDATIKVPCYTGDPKTKGKGTCKEGHRTCDAQGKASATCIGEVVPSKKEACEGKDDDCDGTTDEGCKPTGYNARFGSALITGKGAKYGTRAFVGGSTVGGTSKGTKHSADFGFYAWVASLLSGK